ncbi:hypothetical protein BGZ72_005772 [Mortierella alpina]|nr:hypothetical protein BGZ72_005772 [Mortierella alpina]
MSLTNVQSPFEIPELCSLIASYLTPNDFTQLSLVSKNFSQLFRPFVWSTIVLDGSADSDGTLPRVSALNRYGHLIKDAELVSWYSKEIFSEDEDEDEDEDEAEAILEKDDVLLAEALLAKCGCNLTALTVTDQSPSGRIWEAVMERIHDNRAFKGAQRLNRLQVLDISLAFGIFESAFQPLLKRPNKYPEAMSLFAEVKELRLHATDVIEDLVNEFTWEEELCYGSELDVVYAIPTIKFRELVTLFPRLHRLTLANINIDDDIDIDRSEDRPDDYQFRSLDFQECGTSAKQVVQILKRTHLVQSLKIGSGLSHLGDVGVLISALPVLTPLLKEYEQYRISFSDWSATLQGLPCLTRLHISSDTLVGDDALKTLAGSCPGLEDLRLHYCKSLTSRGLRHILRSCTQLRSLQLPMTPVRWDIFGHDPELRCNPTMAPSTTTTAPSPPSALVPWACQDTLEELFLTLTQDNPPEYMFAARQRLQSFSRLRELELLGRKLPIAVLIDPEHQHPSNGPPTALYPTVEVLCVQNIHPQMTLDKTIKLVKSMPMLMSVRSGVGYDAHSVKWLHEQAL